MGDGLMGDCVRLCSLTDHPGTARREREISSGPAPATTVVIHGQPGQPAGSHRRGGLKNPSANLVLHSQSEQSEDSQCGLHHQ